eukprot:19939-Heterococcus_DN1.PRE.2
MLVKASTESSSSHDSNLHYSTEADVCVTLVQLLSLAYTKSASSATAVYSSLSAMKKSSDMMLSIAAFTLSLFSRTFACLQPASSKRTTVQCMCM